MARSHRHTPIRSWFTCDSEKQDKRIANRCLRAATREALYRDADVYPLMREVSNRWDMGKDGKSYHGIARVNDRVIMGK